MLTISPTGYLMSFLTFPSIAICPSFDLTINLASFPVKASLSLFLNSRFNGTHSLNLCGPHEGFGAYI
jgi:hypothetical protein